MNSLHCWRRSSVQLLYPKIPIKARALYCSTRLSHALILQQVRDIEPVRQVHANIVVSALSRNVYLCNRLMNAYAFCGFIDEAQIIFLQMPEKNLISWTILVSGLTKNGRHLEAIQIFFEMVVREIRPNEVTIASVLPAFGKLQVVLMGKSLHCYWIRQNFGDNVVVETGLVTMYSKFECMRNARYLFDNMPVRNVVSWNAIISGYSENGLVDEGLWMFNEMRRRGLSGDVFTFMSLVRLEDSSIGGVIHGLMTKNGFDNDQLVKTALMELYINCNLVDDAYSTFEETNEKDLVAWTSMLRGFLKSGEWRKIIEHFNNMMGEDGITLDAIPLIILLSGCSSSGALQQGKRIHGLVIKTGYEADVFAGSAVIDMYANCASIKEARRYFQQMEEKDAACWNALISGYGMMGHGNEAIQLFFDMKSSGPKPDESTFVAVLAACSHSSMVTEGLRIFNHMTEVCNMLPTSKHYACVVDLLGRAGRLNDAYSFMKRMRLQPGLEAYASLLTACKIHKNFELGDEISQQLLQMRPDDAGYYILVSNMYTFAGNLTCASMVRKCLKLNNLKKMPGLSSVEINGEIFTFMASQMDHPHYMEIKGFLQDFFLGITAAGYESDTSSVPVDVPDDVKKDILFHHSEKMAIAFGLMRTKPEAVIRITKNLRICSDCHSFCKFISKVYQRVLTVKDSYRFHVFRDGFCCCKDWW